MKKHFLAVFFAVFLILPTAAHAQQYHPPQTPAEQALDRAFHLENSANAAQLAGVFTPQLTNAIANTDQEKVQKNCNGDRTKAGVCGIDYDVLLCAQSNPQAFLYRTINDNGQEAVIAYAWPDSTTDTGVYRLLNESGEWKIDGIDCSGAGADKFNMQ